jgi:hypothetical protein
MLKQIFTALLLLSAVAVSAQITDPKATEFYEPVPPKVKAAPVSVAPPSDAIILLGKGADTKEWVTVNGGGEVTWTKEGDALVVNPGPVVTLATFSCTSNGAAPTNQIKQDRAVVTVASSFPGVMRCKYWKVMAAIPIPMARLVPSTKNLRPWSIPPP